MEDLTKLVNLPWATLLTLASGYAAYYVANVGVRDHHKPVDVTFSTLVFGCFRLRHLSKAIRLRAPHRLGTFIRLVDCIRGVLEPPWKTNP